MKMKLLSKSLIVLFMLPMIAIASNDKGKYSKEKTIKKEFSVNANAGLKVDNAYGNLDVVTWNENRTVIEVLIKTNGDNEEEVIKRLNEITVDFTANASLVTAKTNFGNKKNGSWSWWGKKNSVSMEVHYTVKMPVTNTVDLNNDYGNINLNKLQGNAKINCDYGQLIIGELLAENNSLNFDYTSNSTIGYMKSGKINADYSGFTLDKVERLELNADYTNSEILSVDEINYNCDYGKIQIGKLNKLVGRGDYITTKLGDVTGSLDLNSSYGSIRVDRLTSTVKSVRIDADYTGIKLGFDSSLSFDFNVRTSYSGLSGEDAVTVTKSDKNVSKKNYEGYHNRKNSGTMIDINSTYGGVTFKKL